MPEPMLYRTAGLVEVTDGDGLTVVGMAAPYGEIAVAQDPGGPPYLETFDPGAFGPVIAKWPPRKLKVQLEHPTAAGTGAWVGRGQEWLDGPEGLRVMLRLDDTHDGRAAAFKVRDGQTPAMSISFVPGVTSTVYDAERAAEVVHRQTVRAIGHVALVPAGAYPGALVEAVRAGLAGEALFAGPSTVHGAPSTVYVPPGRPRLDEATEWLATMTASPS